MLWTDGDLLHSMKLHRKEELNFVLSWYDTLCTKLVIVQFCEQEVFFVPSMYYLDQNEEMLVDESNTVAVDGQT